MMPEYYIESDKNFYRIERFIRVLRESYQGSEVVYTEGSCYQFIKIVKAALPDIPFKDYITLDGHAVLMYGGRFFDITGELTDIEAFPIDPLERERLAQLKWGGNLKDLKC